METLLAPIAENPDFYREQRKAGTWMTSKTQAIRSYSISNSLPSSARNTFGKMVSASSLKQLMLP